MVLRPIFLPDGSQASPHNQRSLAVTVVWWRRVFKASTARMVVLVACTTKLLSSPLNLPASWQAFWCTGSLLWFVCLLRFPEAFRLQQLERCRSRVDVALQHGNHFSDCLVFGFPQVARALQARDWFCVLGWRHTKDCFLLMLRR